MSANILLLADESSQKQLEGRISGPDRNVQLCSDAYDLLLAIKHAARDVVVLTAEPRELESLARAARRLAGTARLVAVVGTAAEPQVRSLPPGLLDDYFIFPPTPQDIRSLLGEQLAQAAGTYVSDRAAAPAQEATQLSVGELSELIEAATSTRSLEEATLALLLRRLGDGCRWIDAGALEPQHHALLLLSAPVPRVLVRDDEQAPSRQQQQLLDVLQEHLAALADNARRVEALHRLAITDHLTGAYNRRYFYHVTEQVLARAADGAFRVTLLLYDIDDFKQYNEAYGHAVGDEILRETAALMKSTSRTHDVVARIGGDEFAVLFWDAEPRMPDSRPLEDAAALADRFRLAVRSHSFPSLGPQAKGTLSISGGLASFPDGGTNVRDLLRTADKALRQAKGAGKNIILAGE